MGKLTTDIKKKIKNKSLEPESLHKVYGVGLFFHLVAPWQSNLILAQMADVLQCEPPNFLSSSRNYFSMGASINLSWDRKRMVGCNFLKSTRGNRIPFGENGHFILESWYNIFNRKIPLSRAVSCLSCLFKQICTIIGWGTDNDKSRKMWKVVN